jgi:uncharacterized damage-inducible protein DinB
MKLIRKAAWTSKPVARLSLLYRHFGRRVVPSSRFRFLPAAVYKNTLALKSALSCTVWNGGQRTSEQSAPKEQGVMRLKWIIVFVVGLAGSSLFAQAGQKTDTKEVVSLDAQREKLALQSLSQLAEKLIVSAVDAMPADKFGFAPTDGQFKGVRTFGQMVKHLSSTNHILAAAALGEQPPADAGDEVGPESVRTKGEILEYLKSSFTHLDMAIEAIGQRDVPPNASPISPLKKSEVTRSALVVESLFHAADHYGQMVEYLRMNGVVPPASRP